MGNWIKCKEANGHPIYVNLENAVFLREDTNGNTWIAFIGSEKAHLVVWESADELVQQTNNQAQIAPVRVPSPVAIEVSQRS